MSGEFHEQQEQSDWEILGVDEGETDVEKIKSARRRAALKTHPDSKTGNPEDFKRMDEAYKRIIEWIANSAKPESGGTADSNKAEAIKIYEEMQRMADEDKKRRDPNDPNSEFEDLWG